jgi:hypothetical protein
MKSDQNAMNYRLGHPMTQCGVCQRYRKGAQSPFGSCTMVTGKITPYGLCDRFSAVNNPWGNVLTRQSRRALAAHYDQIRGGQGG